MSVMTAGEHKRRARAAHSRPVATAVPGQPNVTAGPWPGAGEPRNRATHGRPARPGTAGRAGIRPPAGRAEAAMSPAGSSATRPLAGGATVPQSLTADALEARTPAVRSRPARTRVRLTRRGRIVVASLVTAVMVLVAAVAWLAGTARADASGSGVPSSAVYHSLRSVVVMPGQSLWSIVTKYEPTADPGSAIQEIVTLNALRNTSVQPGEHLWLPRG